MKSLKELTKKKMKNKIIFLDIDGVLNVMSQEFDEFGQLFNPVFVNNLAYIIEKTNAKLVISSSWRFRGLKHMVNLWKHRNLPGEIIGVTPDLMFNDDVNRGDEINAWLVKNADSVDNYCIIDDDEDMLPEQMNNFVKTSDNSDHPDCDDIGFGLTRICAEKVIEILNKKNI